MKKYLTGGFVLAILGSSMLVSTLTISRPDKPDSKPDWVTKPSGSVVPVVSVDSGVEWVTYGTTASLDFSVDTWGNSSYIFGDGTVYSPDNFDKTASTLSYGTSSTSFSNDDWKIKDNGSDDFTLEIINLDPSKTYDSLSGSAVFDLNGIGKDSYTVSFGDNYNSFATTASADDLLPVFEVTDSSGGWNLTDGKKGNYNASISLTVTDWGKHYGAEPYTADDFSSSDSWLRYKDSTGEVIEFDSWTMVQDTDDQNNFILTINDLSPETTYNNIKFSAAFYDEKGLISSDSDVTVTTDAQKLPTIKTGYNHQMEVKPTVRYIDGVTTDDSVTFSFEVTSWGMKSNHTAYTEQDFKDEKTNDLIIYNSGEEGQTNFGSVNITSLNSPESKIDAPDFSTYSVTISGLEASTDYSNLSASIALDGHSKSNDPAAIDTYTYSGSTITNGKINNVPTSFETDPVLSGGAIAGIVIGGLVVLAIIVYLVYAFYFKKDKEVEATNE